MYLSQKSSEGQLFSVTLIHNGFLWNVQHATKQSRDVWKWNVESFLCLCRKHLTLIHLERIWAKTILKQGALSIQQKSPVQIFGIFAGRMERVRPLPRTLQTQGMLGETLLFENGGRFEHFRGFRAGWLSNNKLYHSRSHRRRNTSGCSCLLYAEGINSCKWVLRSNYSSVFDEGVRKPFPDD